MGNYINRMSYAYFSNTSARGGIIIYRRVIHAFFADATHKVYYPAFEEGIIISRHSGQVCLKISS